MLDSNQLTNRRITTPAPHHSIFYRHNAVVDTQARDTQPTVSKSSEGNYSEW